MKNKGLFFTGALVLLSSCASTGKKDVVADINIPDEVPYQSIKELKAISVETRHELRLLAKSQEAVNAKILSDEQHEQKLFQNTYVPEEFKQRVDFNYIGELEQAIDAIATIAEWNTKSYGKKPPLPALVNIRLDNQILYEGLREAGMQAGDNIVIEVYPSNKLLVINYK